MLVAPEECWMWEEFDAIADEDAAVREYAIEPAREVLENV